MNQKKKPRPTLYDSNGKPMRFDPYAVPGMTPEKRKNIIQGKYQTKIPLTNTTKRDNTRTSTRKKPK